MTAEGYIRLDLSELERILKAQGIIKEDEALNDAHIEPNELVIRVIKERG